MFINDHSWTILVNTLQVDVFGATCEISQYGAGYGLCLPIQTSANATTCPMDQTTHPFAGRPTCQKFTSSSNWYIHVGGLSTAWDKKSDAKCLSAEPAPRPANRKSKINCQYARSMVQCELLLRIAGCEYSICKYKYTTYIHVHSYIYIIIYKHL